MRTLWRWLTSMRTTAGVLVFVSALLLLNVVLPQQATSDPAHYAQLCATGAGRLFLVTLGLGTIPTSPLFLGGLGVFFLNLCCVSVDRFHATFKRIAVRPPTAEQLRTMGEGPQALRIDRPAGWDPSRAAVVLQRLGFATVRPDDSSVWAIKHPLAPFGSPVFHLSFFVICAAGALIYYTRHERIHYAGEGQLVEGSAAKVVRASPLGGEFSFPLRLLKVEPRLEGGTPVQLGAVLEPQFPGAPRQEAWVNHPAEWSELTVYVERAGLAPMFWLQDARGFTIERASLIARAGQNGEPPGVALEDGRFQVRVAPVAMGPEFPVGEALGRFALTISVVGDGRELFAGKLRPGESVQLGDRTLVLEDLRYWAMLRLIWERGGGLLIAGFILSMIGLIWRMLWTRREVGVLWDAERITLVARATSFPLLYREEVAGIRELLVAPAQVERTKGVSA